ncbi:sigma-70 family RNA polymerase sigma factor [Lapidilactobacillus bayanensis]|uniref:sigma-70 family RNA polymerase sigma factor n=1 Tax=Lapidilactobacillus bayanensis TaxID=2485998 RepID=UPI000F7710B8|nr:sigma-70 family RNA polymerase sigma factor [Lapidilactobacillus bayanensis]
MDEQDVIDALRHHDEKALGQLIENYGDFIQQVILHNLPTSYERGFVQDVENRCYYQVWSKITTYDATKGEFKAWLGTVVKNQAIDYKRGIKGTFQTLAIDENFLVDDAVSTTEEPLDYDELFAPLSETERKIFKLYFIDDLTTKEIAKTLNMRSLAVYKHLSRGRRKLKQEVNQHDF